METTFNFDTTEADKGSDEEYSLEDEPLSIITRALDIPEQLVNCAKWSHRGPYGRERTELIVSSFTVFDEEEKERMCDVVNSNSFSTNAIKGFCKIENLAEGKVTMEVTPLFKVLTGRQLLS